jgi:hypothetical protein
VAGQVFVAVLLPLPSVGARSRLFDDVPRALKVDRHGDENSLQRTARVAMTSGFWQKLSYSSERVHFCLMSVSFSRKLCRRKL